MSEGKSLPILKFHARNGTLSTIDYTMDGRGRETSTTTDITARKPKFALDFGSLEVGWAAYAPSMGWRWRVVPFGVPVPSCPDPERDAKGGEVVWREATRLFVIGREIGGLRGFGGNSEVVNTALRDLHARFRTAPEAADGLVPLVQMARTEQVRRGRLVLYEPVFEIERWVARLPHLGRRLVPPPPRPEAKRLHVIELVPSV